MDDQTQASRILAGAAVGAVFAFLFLTKSGNRLLDRAEPWLDDLLSDMQRLRSAAAKANSAMEEGRRSFTAVSQLGKFGSKDDGWSQHASH